MSLLLLLVHKLLPSGSEAYDCLDDMFFPLFLMTLIMDFGLTIGILGALGLIA